MAGAQTSILGTVCGGYTHTHCNWLWLWQFCSQRGEVKRAIWAATSGYKRVLSLSLSLSLVRQLL